MKIAKRSAAQRSMVEGPLISGILLYTLPVVLTGILQLLFNAADLVIVGQFCGSLSVAAVGATGAVTALIVNLFIGLSVGAGVTVAHGLGGEDDETVSRTVHTAIPTALICGVLLAIIGIAAARPLLVLMDTPGNVLPLSVVYMQIYFAGMPFAMVYNFSASILRAAGDTKSPLLYLTIAGVINVCLNILFVTVLHMNVAGVALATTLSQIFSAVMVVRTLMHRSDACRLNLRDMRIYRAQLMKIMRIGIPAGIQNAMFSISNVIIQSSINSFGDAVMSGNAAAGNIDGFLYVICNSFQQAAVNYIGQNVGAGKYERVNRIYAVCMVSATVLAGAAGVGVYLAGETLLGIYIPDSVEAIRYGMVRLTWCALPYFILGMMDVTSGALRGMGASVTPMLIYILGICGLRIGWIFTVFQIPEYHSLESLYATYAISWTFTFAALLLAFILVYRKHTKNKAYLQRL